MMKRLLYAIVLAMPLLAWGQEGSYASRVGEPVQLPGEGRSVIELDGEVYVCVGGLLLRVHESDGEVSFVLPDTLPVTSQHKAEYAVRHPQSGRLYFTKAKAFGKHYLYELVHKDNGKLAAVRVKPGGRSVSVENPVFSIDGRYMVFYSKDLYNFGGYDLYISELVGEGWGMPLNIGKSVNTKGNEVVPVFCGDYLVYATNGNADGFGGYDFYASKIRFVADNAGALHPSFSKPSHLPMPLSSSDDDRSFAFTRKRVYMTSDRDSAAMGDKLYVYDCELDGYMLTGQVTDMRGRPQARSMVVVRSGGREVATTQTGLDGNYIVYLKKNTNYEIIFSKVGYGMERYRLFTERQDENNLYYSQVYDVKLECFEPGDYVEFDGLFGNDAAVELSAAGRDRLRALAGFLSVNPHAPVVMTMYCNVAGDLEFDKMVAEQRILAVKKYLLANAPKADRYQLQNGGEMTDKEHAKPKNDLLVMQFGNF